MLETTINKLRKILEKRSNVISELNSIRMKRVQLEIQIQQLEQTESGLRLEKAAIDKITRDLRKEMDKDLAVAEQDAGLLEEKIRSLQESRTPGKELSHV